MNVEETNTPALDQLADILSSNLSEKEQHVLRLQSAYPDEADDLQSAYDLWMEMTPREVPAPSANMDKTFYQALQEEVAHVKPKLEYKTKEVRMSPTYWWAAAAIFLGGLLVGQLMSSRSQHSTELPSQYASDVQPHQNNLVSFASVERMPSASLRMKGIKDVQAQEAPDMRVIEALDQVIRQDPNVNVRLIAIQTMLHFSDIPEARAYLIESIPYQTFSIVQLELADIMIKLEEKASADEWQELLSSDNVEVDVKLHLSDNLKSIL